MIFFTVLNPKKLDKPIEMPVAEPLDPKPAPAWLDSWTPWLGGTIALILLSYGPNALPIGPRCPVYYHWLPALATVASKIVVYNKNRRHRYDVGDFCCREIDANCLCNISRKRLYSLCILPNATAAPPGLYYDHSNKILIWGARYRCTFSITSFGSLWFLLDWEKAATHVAAFSLLSNFMML
ncbi:MAG: hypothetical protein R2932_12110 [Caldilineaceae bacterium]